MDRHRYDEAHHLTPRAYRCPACGASSRMAIEWPFWRCPLCSERLIPADLQPADTPTSTVTIAAAPNTAAGLPEGPAAPRDTPRAQ